MKVHNPMEGGRGGVNARKKEWELGEMVEGLKMEQGGKGMELGKHSHNNKNILKQKNYRGRSLFIFKL